MEDADYYPYVRLWVYNPSHVYFDMSLVLENDSTVNYYDMSKAKLISKDGQQISAELGSAEERGTASGVRIPKQFEGWVVLPLTTENLKASNGYSTVLSAFADAKHVSIENRRVKTSTSTEDYYILDELVLDRTILGEVKSTEDGVEYDKFDVTEKGSASLKNVIFMIGDGMGDGSLAAARLNRNTLYLDSIPRAGYIGTNEATDQLTDSAAAGTALATGYKTLNGMVGLTPDNIPIMNLSEWMLQFGKKVGLVTSSYMVDGKFIRMLPFLVLFHDIFYTILDIGILNFVLCIVGLEVREPNKVINDGRYSHCAVDNDLRVMVARSCAYLDHYGRDVRDEEMEFIDKGEHEFNFILFPHIENATADIANCGRVLNMPPVLVQETHHDGILPQEYSALEVDKKNISISALKNSENGDGLIVRFSETSGTSTTATVNFKVINRNLELSFTPQEVKTIRLGKDGAVEEIRIIEQ